MKSNRISFFLVVCFLDGTAIAQPQLWEIYTTSNQPYVNVIIDRYQSDSLYLKFANQSAVLHQDSIRYILRRNSSKFGIGLLAGAVAGGIFGSLASTGGSSDYGISSIGRGIAVTGGIAIGAVIGGAVGAAAGADTRYQFEKLDPEQKRKLLARLSAGG